VSFLIASGHVSVEAKTDKAMSAITGVVGALGALGPVAGVAAAGMAAAGAGIAAFGVAAGKQVADLKKASEAQGKYQDAVARSGKGSQEAAKAEVAYQQTLSKMPRATREATAAFSALSDSYKEWSDSLAGDTMPVFTKSFQLFSALLPKTSGLVRGTSTELDRMVTLLAGGMASPGFDRFMGKLENFSADTLHAMTDGVIDLSRSLGSFAAGGGFDGFVDTAKEVGPLLGETLGNVAKALLNLTTAGGEVGISMLTAANALAELVNAVPPEVIGTFLQLYAAFKLAKIGAAALTAVTTSSAAAGLTNFVRAAQFGGVGSAISGVAQRMTVLQKAAGALGVLGIAAFAIDQLAESARGAPPDVDRLVSSLKTLNTTGKFTGELKSTFKDMDGFIAKIRQLDQGTKELDAAKPFMDLVPGGPIVEKLAGKVDDLVNGTKSLGATKDDVKSFDQAFASMATGGHAKTAAEEFAKFDKALRASGKSTAEINALFPEYKSAVAGLKAEQEIAARGMGLFGQQAIDTKTKLDAQKASADGLRQSIQALNDINRASLGGMIGFEASIDAAAKAARENAGSLRMVNGELDVNSPKAQAAATALADLGAKTDAATAAAREGGASWERVNGIYSRGRDQLVKYAQQMGLSKTEAGQLADSILKIPHKHSTQVEMKREDALAGLDSVIAKIKATPGAKSVTVKTLSSSAIAALEAVGLKVKRLPDGSVTVTSRNGQALSAIGAVQAARDRLSNKSITITTFYTYKGKNIAGVSAGRMASGGRVKGYAGGGNIQGFPEGGYIEGPGSGTSDSILALMGSGAAAMVSNTEYVMRSAAVAKYGVGFMDAVNSGQLKLPGFAKGGKLSAKQKAAAAAEQEARKDLAGFTSLSYFSRNAGFKNDEFINATARAGSVGGIVSGLNQMASLIKKASHGKAEEKALRAIGADGSGNPLFNYQRKLEGVNKALDGAKTKLEDLKGKFDSLKTSVSSSLVSFGNITKIGKYGTSPETLLKQLRSDTGRTTQFATQLEQLKAKGLNGQSISDIAAAGVTGGGMSTAQSLLNATPAQIAEINALEKQLKLSADKAGTVTADAMYGAGIRSAEGLVKGLTSQQDKIEAAMMKIAQSMEKAIKKALGIKSPAARMVPVGDYTFQGVEQGWAKRMAKGNTLLSGSAAGLRLKPTIQAGGAGLDSPVGPSVVVHLAPTFHTMTLPSPAERKAFAKAMVKEFNDELLTYQKARRR
jgi:hypothetical protein